MTRHLAILLAVVAAIAACSPAPAALTASPGGFLSILGAWARPGAAGSDSAAYFTITNGQLADDVLVGASTPAAQSAQVHQTTTDASGMTGMHEADAVTIPAGKDVVFEEGGYHVMLVGLKDALAAGGTFPLTLTFEQTGPVTVTVEVRGN